MSIPSALVALPTPLVLSLTQKLIIFSLILVTGTSLLVQTLCTKQSEQKLETQRIAAAQREANQLVDALGVGLVQDQPESTATRGNLLATLSRVIERSESRISVYSVVFQDQRSLLVLEARRKGEARKFGSAIALPHAGHRAQRTLVVQSEIDDRDILRTFAPVIDGNRRIQGLLVTESRLDRATLGAHSWLAMAIAVLAGILALAILVISIARPLERMQEQLIAKQELAPTLVRGPADLLREVTLIIDKSHADRDYFEARSKQQDRQQESSIRRKDEVISNTVHELRTPLTAIIASLELLTDSEGELGPEDQREFMGQCQSAARHMMFVVNDMLDAAALEAGKVHMEIKRCRLGGMLQDAARSMEIVASARAMNLDVEEVAPGIEVFADAPRLTQVIFNLVSNAVKYAPRATRITMRAWTSLNSVIIEVEDQGTPIAVEKRDQLFTKFSPVKCESRDTNVESTGIGLYLTKKLLAMMNGTIGYRPAEGDTGSVFWFTLPVAHASTTDSSIAEAISSSVIES